MIIQGFCTDGFVARTIMGLTEDRGSHKKYECLLPRLLISWMSSLSTARSREPAHVTNTADSIFSKGTKSHPRLNPQLGRDRFP
jgi:hypothetical protein